MGKKGIIHFQSGRSKPQIVPILCILIKPQDNIFLVPDISFKQFNYTVSSSLTLLLLLMKTNNEIKFSVPGISSFALNNLASL